MSATKTCRINRTKFKTPDEAMIYFGIDYTEIRELAHNLGCSTIDALNFALNDTAYESYSILRGNECKFIRHKACGTGAIIHRKNQDYINYVLYQLRTLGKPLWVDIENDEIKAEDPRAALAIYVLADYYIRELNSIYNLLSDKAWRIKRYNNQIYAGLSNMMCAVRSKAVEAERLERQALHQIKRDIIGLEGEISDNRLNKVEVAEIIKIYKQSPIFISLGFVSIIESALNLNDIAKSIIKQQSEKD